MKVYRIKGRFYTAEENPLQTTQSDAREFTKDEPRSFKEWLAWDKRAGEIAKRIEKLELEKTRCMLKADKAYRRFQYLRAL